MDKEEYKRRMAEIQANYTPLETKAAKLVKPILLLIPLIFIVAFIIMMIEIANKPEISAPIEQSYPIAQISDDEKAKWQSFNALTDCQLAYNIYSEYSPIMAELMAYAKVKTPFNHQEAVNWKQTHKLDERLERLSNKYPATYNVNYPNAIIAHGMEFAIGQYWRDIFSHARNDRLGTPFESDQTQLMQDDLNVLTSQCPAEFRG